MKREILFRGKRIDNGEWVEGFYGTGINRVAPDMYKHVIMEWTIGNTSNYFTDIDVIPESVGQFTGLTDKNGVKIFEGDIVNVLKNEEVIESNKEAFFNNGSFCTNIDYDHIEVPLYDWLEDSQYSFEIISSIHD